MTTMKIYLSWSGELGRRASGVLRDALDQLLPNLEIWSPGSDIAAGMRWRDELQHAIQTSDLALVCVTNDSRSSPWLLYEVGVISGHAITVMLWLVDVDASELVGPLAQFQAIRSDSQSFQMLADLVFRRQSMKRHPDRVARWAASIEAEINQLLRREPQRGEPTSAGKWLAQIDDAATSRNADQLQTLKNAAESEGVSDLNVVRALVNAYFALRDFSGVIDTFERFETAMGDDPEVLSRYAWALVRGGQSSRAITVLEEARKRGIAGAEITALLARAYKDQWRERTTKGNTTAAEESLRRAAEIYTDGFKMHPDDYNLGLNAVQLLHLLGDARSLAHRDALLPHVHSPRSSKLLQSPDMIIGRPRVYWTLPSLEDLRLKPDD